MSVQSTSKQRLVLESLETREVPAVFVGGWESSVYQHVDPDSPHVVYLGGSRRVDWTPGQITEVKLETRPTALSRDFSLDIRGVNAVSRAGKQDGIIEIRDSLALGPPNVTRDQFVFGVEMPTPARDFPLDIPPIKGEASDEKNKPQSTGATQGRGVFILTTDRSIPQNAITAPNGVAGDGATEDFFTVEFAHGRGASATPSGAGSLGIEVGTARRAEPLPVLLVIANRD